MEDKKIAPKWGTKEWIKAYPWSKMDRKRRRRVLAALPPEVSGPLDQTGHVTCLCDLQKGITLRDPKRLARIDKLLVSAGTQVSQALDILVAAALENVWCTSGK